MDNENSTLNNLEPTGNVSSMKTGMKWGAIIALASIIISLLFYFVKGTMESNWIQTVLSLVLIFGGLSMGIKEQRDVLQNGNISFGKAFGTSMLIAMFYGIIGAFFMFLFMKFGDSSLIDKTLEQTAEKMRDKGQSEEQVELAIEMTKKMMSPVMMGVWAFVGTLVMALIPALIMSAILKKEKPESGF